MLDGRWMKSEPAEHEGHVASQQPRPDLEFLRDTVKRPSVINKKSTSRSRVVRTPGDRPAAAVQQHVTSIFEKLGLHNSPEQHRRVLAVLDYLRS